MLHLVDAEAVDLFAGPGGWDVAARRLGLRVTGIETDESACRTRWAAELLTVHGDVRDYRPGDFAAARNLISSPPCQPFGISGKGSGRRDMDTVLALAAKRAARQDIRADLAELDDERTGLVLEPLRWALEAIDAGRPYRTVMLEQVPTVLPIWEAMADLLRAEGYSVRTDRLSAERYGVPQTRVRAILTARLDGEARLPEPTHRAYRKGVAQADGDPALLPWLSMADGIGWGMTHRPALTITAGTGAGGADPSFVGGSGARATLYGERDAGRWVTCTRPFPPDEMPVYKGGRKDTIRLTISESGMLQGFDPDHPWRGTKTKASEQTANAFPPPVAEAVITAGLALTRRTAEVEAA